MKFNKYGTVGWHSDGIRYRIMAAGDLPFRFFYLFEDVRMNLGNMDRSSASVVLEREVQRL